MPWADISRLIVIYSVLVGLILVVYGQTRTFSFVNYDDNLYVVQNENIRAGLTGRGVVWAFTHVHSQNWHPLTTMSHMLDCRLFGLDAGSHHLVNVGWHILTSMLLFTFLRYSTGAVWASAAAAALFAVHPLRVESVAWISERKDVLSGFFFAATLLSYWRYAMRRTWSRFLLTLVCFGCGLLSKPMLVTTPLILLFVDYWPLERWRCDSWWKIWREKIPFVLLAAGSSLATLLAQRLALGTTTNMPLSWRATNSIVSYINYLRQTFWPTDLLPFYPHHEGTTSLWQAAFAAIFLFAISAGVYLGRRRRPYLFVGWFWYMIMLLPVIGLVQVGLQGRADRYTYLPQIGLIIAVTWSARELSFQKRQNSIVLSVVTCLLIGALTWLSYSQATHWRDSRALWGYALRKSAPTDVAATGLAGAELSDGDIDDAIAHYRQALSIREGNAAAHHGIGVALLTRRKVDEAVAHLQRSLEIQPDNSQARNTLGHALSEVGRPEEAVQQWEQTLAYDENDVDAANSLGWTFATTMDPLVRDGVKAVRFAERAAHATGGRNAMVLRTLAVAFAEAREFELASETANRAKQLASAQGKIELAAEMDRLLMVFKEKKSVREYYATP